MSRHAKTRALLETAAAVLADNHPMTVRQVYYQLVSRQVIENNRSQYQAVSNALVDARKSGEIPWDWIEDRLRRPRTVNMWADLSDFAETACQAYRRDVWPSQSSYVEFWLEKDALSGIFQDLLRPYGVTLNVGVDMTAGIRFTTPPNATVTVKIPSCSTSVTSIRAARTWSAVCGNA